MTKNKWKNIIDSCHEVSNVTFVCSDGTLHSHKIMIAVIREAFKRKQNSEFSRFDGSYNYNIKQYIIIIIIIITINKI